MKMDSQDKATQYQLVAIQLMELANDGEEGLGDAINTVVAGFLKHTTPQKEAPTKKKPVTYPDRTYQPRKCDVCHKEYTPGSGAQKTCSPECRKKAHQKKMSSLRVKGC